jgi:hypothetical protein
MMMTFIVETFCIKNVPTFTLAYFLRQGEHGKFTSSSMYLKFPIASWQPCRLIISRSVNEHKNRLGVGKPVCVTAPG